MAPNIHFLYGFGTINGQDFSPFSANAADIPGSQAIGEKVFIYTTDYSGTVYGGTIGQDGGRGTQTLDSLDPESYVEVGAAVEDRQIIVGMKSDFHWLNQYNYNSFFLMEIRDGESAAILFVYPTNLPSNPIRLGLNGHGTDPWPIFMDATTGVMKTLEVRLVAASTSSSSDGEIEVRIDGVQKFLSTGEQIGFGTREGRYFGNFYFAPFGTGDNYYIISGDDADFLTNMKTREIYAQTDHAVDFTPSAGSNAALMVEENISDGETTYVQGGTVGQECLFRMQTLTPPTGYEIIENVQYLIDARRIGPGRRKIAARCLIDGVRYTGGGVDICPTGYRYNWNIKFSMPRNPATGERWTHPVINDSYFGFVIVE